MTGRGGGPSDYFGYEILAKGDFLGLRKTPGFFWVAKKNTEGFFFACKKELRNFFGGMLKIVVILLGRQILKL